MLKNIIATNVNGQPVNGSVGEDRVLASVYRILNDSALGAISTVTRDNQAHINIAYIAYTGDLRLCFMSHPNSHHCHNLANNSSMAVSVNSSGQHWGGPDLGLQLFGSCRMAMGNEATHALRVYGERFSQHRQWAASLPETALGREYRLFWFTAAELTISDEREFGDGILVTAIVQR